MKVIYGKYYTRKGKTYKKLRNQKADLFKDFTDNTYFVFKPPMNLDPAKKPPSGKLPVMLFAFGNGWLVPLSNHVDAVHGKMNPAIGRYVSEGIAYVSMSYRSVDWHYWYDEPAAQNEPTYLEDAINIEGKPEELIHVDSSGRLSLDKHGRTMADYKTRVCYQELMMKSIYDCVQGLEHLIRSADILELDVHRIFFFASSAGTAEVNYLTWVYHRWHKERYTPVGMILNTPQFDYPTDCALDRVWQSWSDHVGGDTKVSSIMDFAHCHVYIGNDGCAMDYKNEGSGFRFVGCNKTWNDLTMQRFCTQPQFDTLTVSGMLSSQKWNNADPEVGRGMEKLWYVSQNMLAHQPKPFYIMATSITSAINPIFFAHASTYVRAYAELAARAGINYTVYYASYPGMVNSTLDKRLNDDVSIPEKGSYVLYRSSFAWRETYPKIAKTFMNSIAEHVVFACYVFRMEHCGPNSQDPAIFQ